jgi:hypothetical protein
VRKFALVLGKNGTAGGPVQINSSLTDFGIVDLALHDVRNENLGSDTAPISGTKPTGHIGFRGNDDYGSNVTAIGTRPTLEAVLHDA